jgi:hypothetical protein
MKDLIKQDLSGFENLKGKPENTLQTLNRFPKQ